MKKKRKPMDWVTFWIAFIVLIGLFIIADFLIAQLVMLFDLLKGF